MPAACATPFITIILVAHDELCSKQAQGTAVANHKRRAHHTKVPPAMYSTCHAYVEHPQQTHHDVRGGMTNVADGHIEKWIQMAAPL